MPSAAEIRAQLDVESERRARLGVPAAAGGVLFLLSAIIVNAVVSGLPQVGLLQGLEPALRGTVNPTLDARADLVRYISDHALSLIAASVLEAIAAIVLSAVLLFLLSAARFRRPDTPRLAGPLVIAGGSGVAVFGIASQVIRAIRTHEFATGHDFSGRAVEQAVSKGFLNIVGNALSAIALLVLMIGMIMVLISATRVGLLTRWLRGLGIAAAIVSLPLFAGIFYLQLLPAAWLIAISFLFLRRLPADPPAWAAGEARPWPSSAEMRAAKRAGQGKPALAAPGGPAPAPGAGPAPAPGVPGGSSRRRRRKRGSRG
jgi:hypothetical protein